MCHEGGGVMLHCDSPHEVTPRIWYQVQAFPSPLHVQEVIKAKSSFTRWRWKMDAGSILAWGQCLYLHYCLPPQADTKGMKILSYKSTSWQGKAGHTNNPPTIQAR